MASLNAKKRRKMVKEEFQPDHADPVYHVEEFKHSVVNH